jgi:hypothetical protein
MTAPAQGSLTDAGRTGQAVRAVVDTSSLVAYRRDLQALAQAGFFTAIWSPWIIAELNRVLTWHWLTRIRPHDSSAESYARCSQAAKTMMSMLFATFTLVHPEPPYPPAWATLADVWDEPIWAAAKLSVAQFVISQNTRDFPPAGSDGRCVFDDIEYLTAETFMAMLNGDVPAPPNWQRSNRYQQPCSVLVIRTLWNQPMARIWQRLKLAEALRKLEAR